MSDAGLTLAVLGLLKKIRLYRLPDETPGESPEEQQRAFGRFDTMFNLVTLVVVVPFGFAWHRLFIWIAGFAHPAPGASGQILEPSVFYWVLPALFAGIVTAAMPSFAIARLVLKERYGDYVAFYNRKHGFDSFRMFRHLAVIVAVLVMCGVYLGATSYTAFLSDRIVIKGPLAAPRTYAYGDITAINAVLKGTAGAGSYEILFADGYQWESSDGLRDSEPRCDYPAIAMAQELSGLPVIGPDIAAWDFSETAC